MACTFLLISGICYSRAFHREMPMVTLTSDKDGQEKEKPEDAQSEDMENDPTSKGQLEETSKVSSEMKQEKDGIYAHICGAVVHPGVYKAKPEARVVDFIALAGGLTEDADGDYMNQAEIVMDGQRIYIPTKEEVKQLDLQDYLQGDSALGDGNALEDSAKSQALINLNEASAEELMQLPGIGQAKADSIIAYRKQHGAFQTPEELMNIPGIKEGVYNQISSQITVN